MPRIACLLKALMKAYEGEIVRHMREVGMVRGRGIYRRWYRYCVHGRPYVGERGVVVETLA